MSKMPFNRVNWPTSIFLAGTLLISLTAVPFYLWHFGLEGFQVILFLGLITGCFPIILSEPDGRCGSEP